MVFINIILFSIVMEFADNGDLFQKITEHQKNNSFFSETEIWSIFIQVVRGLRSLHELQIMHRDLKSANVFLFKDSTAKLGDLNVSKVAKKGLNYTQTGGPYYASPEVWRDQPYDVKSDMWSLGCVLYEMITLKPPFRAEDMASLYKKVLKGIYPKIPNTYSQDLAAMVKHLLHVSPHLRPTCDKVLKLPIVLNRIQKLFPEENFEQQEQNVLLNTIRIPKNILYLSDRLPKPSYSDIQKESEDIKRNTTGQSLPYISSNKKPRQKNPGKIRMKPNKYKEILENPSIEDGYYNDNNSLVKHQKPNKIQSLLLNENTEDSGVRQEPSLIIKSKEPEKNKEQDKEKEKDDHKKVILSSKVKENVKPSKSKLNSVIEELEKEMYNNSNKKDAYLPDSYIHQLVNKRNPIIKPLNQNMQKIADIYSGNYAQKILAIQKR